ncbi:hypothetical protein [Nostoc sp.]
MSDNQKPKDDSEKKSKPKKPQPPSIIGKPPKTEGPERQVPPF